MDTANLRAQVSLKRPARLLLAIGAALLLFSALLAATATTASAHVCDSGYFCAWNSETCSHASNHERWFNQSFNWPDHIEEQEDCVRNNGTIGAPVAVYDSNNHSDFHYCVFQGHTVNLPFNKDNDGASHRWESSRTGCF